MKTHVRIARPSDDIDALLPFYREGLGFDVIGLFRDHDGFDGIMLGHPEWPYHFEFTKKAGHPVGKAPTQDHLLVFYIEDQERWNQAVKRMIRYGFSPVPAFNPYWDMRGKTFEDPDGYRIVLQNAGWTNKALSAAVLETERLMLRRLTAEDAIFMLKLLNEPAYHRFIGDRKVRTPEDARAFMIGGPIASYDRFGFGLYLVLLKDTGEPLGICGLIQRDFLSDPDIGFAFLADHWSKGYAYEAAAAVMRYGRETLGMKQICAIVSPDNERSIRLLTKLGLRFDKMMQYPGDQSAVALYASPGERDLAL